MSEPKLKPLKHYKIPGVNGIGLLIEREYKGKISYTGVSPYGPVFFNEDINKVENDLKNSIGYDIFLERKKSSKLNSDLQNVVVSIITDNKNWLNNHTLELNSEGGNK